MRASPFSFKGTALALTMRSEKFVRLDLSGTVFSALAFQIANSIRSYIVQFLNQIASAR